MVPGVAIYSDLAIYIIKHGYIKLKRDCFTSNDQVKIHG